MFKGRTYKVYENDVVIAKGQLKDVAFELNLPSWIIHSYHNTGKLLKDRFIITSEEAELQKSMEDLTTSEEPKKSLDEIPIDKWSDEDYYKYLRHLLMVYGNGLTTRDPKKFKYRLKKDGIDISYRAISQDEEVSLDTKSRVFKFRKHYIITVVNKEKKTESR